MVTTSFEQSLTSWTTGNDQMTQLLVLFCGKPGTRGFRKNKMIGSFLFSFLFHDKDWPKANPYRGQKQKQNLHIDQFD